MAGEIPGAYFISYFSALGMEPASFKIYVREFKIQDSERIGLEFC